jgi:transcriptional regulator with XRE-family HTH domain
MLLSERIKFLREKRGISMKEFGSRFGLAESTISGYEAGTRRPNLEVLAQIADFFEVTVDYLLGRTNNPIFTHEEENLLNDINLPLEELKEKYNLTYDGKELTDSELRGILTWIKANRMIESEKK